MSVECPPIRVARAVADEILAAVLDGTLTQAFTPRFSFGSEIAGLEDMNADDGLKVDVMPHMAPAWSPQAQSTVRHDCRAKVGIRRRIEPTDRDSDGAIETEAIADYANLLYEILTLFALGRKLTTVPEAAWDPRSNPEIRLYDEILLKQGLYVGWVHLPFVLHESV
jgi:hypothetical protein